MHYQVSLHLLTSFLFYGLGSLSAASSNYCPFLTYLSSSMRSSDWRNLWHIMSCFHLFQAGTSCDWLRAVHSLFTHTGHPADTTTETLLFRTNTFQPPHLCETDYSEHFEYLSIMSSFNIITSLTYMRYKIFLSCKTVIHISTMCTYMQQNSTPCSSKQVIGVYTL